MLEVLLLGLDEPSPDPAPDLGDRNAEVLGGAAHRVAAIGMTTRQWRAPWQIRVVALDVLGAARPPDRPLRPPRLGLFGFSCCAAPLHERDRSGPRCADAALAGDPPLPYPDRFIVEPSATGAGRRTGGRSANAGHVGARAGRVGAGWPGTLGPTACSGAPRRWRSGRRRARGRPLMALMALQSEPTMAPSREFVERRSEARRLRQKFHHTPRDPAGPGGPRRETVAQVPERVAERRWQPGFGERPSRVNGLASPVHPQRGREALLSIEAEQRR